MFLLSRKNYCLLRILFLDIEMEYAKFFTLRASRRGSDRENFRESWSKNINFPNFSDARDAWQEREIRADKISALNTLGGTKNIKKAKKKIKNISGFRIQFFVIFNRFWRSYSQTGPNRPQNQIRHQILLQIHNS